MYKSKYRCPYLRISGCKQQQNGFLCLLSRSSHILIANVEGRWINTPLQAYQRRVAWSVVEPQSSDLMLLVGIVFESLYYVFVLKLGPIVSLLMCGPTNNITEAVLTTTPLMCSQWCLPQRSSSVSGWFERETDLLEGSEAAGQEHLRRPVVFAVLPPQQQPAVTHHTQVPQSQSQRHQWKVRWVPQL